MPNEQNLIPFNERTESEQREIASAGGRASGKARRDKKMLRECIEYLLERQDPTVLDENGEPMSGAEQLAYKLFTSAMSETDTSKAAKAFEVLRDTAGQKPVDKVMITDVDPSVIEEVEAMVNGS